MDNTPSNVLCLMFFKDILNAMLIDFEGGFRNFL